MHLRHPLPLVLCAILVLISTSLCWAEEPAQKPDEPKISDVRFVKFHQPTADDKVSFRLAIDGDNLPKSATRDDVRFTTKDPTLPVEVLSLVAANKKEILVDATARVGTEITGVTVAEGNATVVTSRAFTVSIQATPPAQKLKQFEIKFDHEKNNEFPNLHSLLVTKEGGEGGFAENPNWMRVDLMPTGATDVNIVQCNDQQLDLHFVAAADYEPKSLVVTVYDGSDLDKRQATAVAIAKKPPAEDPAQPKIIRTDIVFVNRSHGVGRIRIYGKGFGDYPPPPYAVDEYLWNCLEEFHIRGTDAKNKWVKSAEAEDANARTRACAEVLKGNVVGGIDAQERNQLIYTKTNLATYITDAQRHWEEWGEEIRRKVTVGVNSRNTDIAVERVEILDINDKMIDVYFEFTRYRGFAYPFRLADASVTVKKMLPETTQTVKNDKVTGTVIGVKQVTFTVPYQPGPKRDPNLTYKYTVLDRKSANTLLGKGIADNFYVLQLSVVNNGEKKVTIPLAAIQAEVEWVRGEEYDKNGAPSVSYLAGPPTLAPIPLAAVSAYFDAYQKAKGRRAIVFNILDATTTAATALVPFTGPSLKDAEVFFSGGFVPGVRKAVGDLSGQQLQNLTSLSWESSETLPAKGGSMEKLIYIQNKEQFSSTPVKAAGVPREARKQIANIMDLEITGFEVIESEAKQATQTTATPPPAGQTPSSSQAPPQSAAPTTPATPAQPHAKSKDQEKP